MAGPLLHGSTPWLIAESATRELLDTLRGDAEEGVLWTAEGNRLPMPESAALQAGYTGDAEAAGVIVAGLAPTELEPFVDSLPHRDGQLVAVADLRVPGWRASRDVQAGPHVFHVYEPRAATFDETHQLAIVHPQYDGFLVSTLRAWRDIAELRLVVDGELVDAVTTHHLEGPLRRGQHRAIDIELHPGIVPERGLTGGIAAYDADDPLGVRLELTVATSPALEAVIAGREAGPMPPAAFDLAIAALTAGDETPRKVARRISGSERSRSWLPWRRRGDDE